MFYNGDEPDVGVRMPSVVHWRVDLPPPVGLCPPYCGKQKRDCVLDDDGWSSETSQVTCRVCLLLYSQGVRAMKAGHE